MTAHSTLKDALREAIKASGQTEALYRRLEAWLDLLSSGSLDLTRDREDTITRMADIIDAIHINGDEQ